MKRGCAGLLLALFLIAILGAALFGWVITLRNHMVALDQDVKSAWAQVESQYQRRADLIPRYVALVREYAQHERAVFDEVSSARAALIGAVTPQQKIAAGTRLDSALGRLLAIAERYPDLKASENYLALQYELAGTENRIAVERMRYNEAVREYNRTAKSAPVRWFIGGWRIDKEKPFFEVPKAAEKPPAV
jgi:LemA protein